MAKESRRAQREWKPCEEIEPQDAGADVRDQRETDTLSL